MKYYASIEVDGKSCLILPRTRKSTLFCSVESAEKALERQGKRLASNGRGTIKDTDGNCVLTIAL